jgi:hypothetical protein
MLGAPIDVADRFQCLDASQQQLARPVVATLQQGIEALGDQMLALQYPKHPNFGGESKNFEIKGAAVKRVFECVQRAARDPLHRTIVEKERRKEVREIVEPLELGEMSEDALRLKDYWQSLLDRHVAQSKGDAITVGRLRQWIEEQPRGLPKEVQDLVILTYAEVGNRRFLKLGGSYQVSIERGLDNDLELREQQLPSEKDWDAAREHAAAFGLDVGSQRGPANVGKLIEDVKALDRGWGAGMPEPGAGSSAAVGDARRAVCRRAPMADGAGCGGAVRRRVAGRRRDAGREPGQGQGDAFVAGHGHQLQAGCGRATDVGGHSVERDGDRLVDG